MNLKRPKQSTISALARRMVRLGIPDDMISDDCLGLIVCGKLMLITREHKEKCPDCGKPHRAELLLHPTTKKPLGELFRK